ncbi:MAG: hypothetical protein ACHQ4J_17045 [Candidatus Binatia bacterium]
MRALAQRTTLAIFVAGAMVVCRAPRACGGVSVRFGDVVSLAGNALAQFDGDRIDRLALLSCIDASCRPIPFQIDECDARGQWALDHGPEPTADEPPGVLDGNDVLLFMAADAGDHALRTELPRSLPAAEIGVHDPLDGTMRWVYLVRYPRAAPRAAAAYVRYDPLTDRVCGARVSLGFDRGVPDYLACTDGAAADANLLDRLKVRAAATFLFGLLRFSRSEDDLTTQFSGWREGPIRVIRRQRQWVRIGWGIRSPTFGSYTYFYRDFAELPVGLSLNFPPHYFFGNIVVRAVLDFRDLRGWSLVLPSMAAPIAIDGTMTAQKEALNSLPDSWFALLGPHVTLVQTLDVSPSLASVRRRLYYREALAARDPPETVPGAEPAVGYQLDQWERVGAGAHQLAAVSYALPPDVDVGAFMAARNAPLQTTVRTLP